MPTPVDDAASAVVTHATWPDVALWVLQHDGFAWALVAAVVLLTAYKHDAIVTAWSNALDRRDARRAARRRELREPAVVQERLNADMRPAEKRLRLPHRQRPGDEGEGG